MKFMNYRIIVLILFIIVSPLALGQNMGHPGGGTQTGEDENLIQVKCINSLTKARELERNFLKSWEKKYKKSQDFILLVRELNSKFLLDDLRPFLNGTELTNYLCEKIEQKPFLKKVRERESYKQELKQLEETIMHWDQGIKNIRNGNVCYNHFSERKSEFDGLKNLLRNYKRCGDN